MTITLQMPETLEARLRAQAAREGVDADTIVLRALEREVGPAKDSSPLARESELLLRITDGPPEAVWRRYHDLAPKRDAETLTPAEYEELIKLSEAIESVDVKRLEYMAELAKLRGVSLRAIRSQLAIPESGFVGPR
jgi:hypothetical protein